MSAKQAMSTAQRLYEKGFITYMRTDSVALSAQAIEAARSQAVALYGEGAVPLNPRVYKSKSKNAQEAHEAIRPSGEEFRTPASLSSELDRDEQRLYDLIWKRTVASQMSDATYETTTVTLEVNAGGRLAEFTASGTVYTFKGFLQAYEEGRDEKRSDADKADEQSLPSSPSATRSAISDVEPKGHSTTPEAALHRGEPRQGAGGEGHRAPLDVRQHHRHDHRARLRHQARAGARAQLARVQRGAAARSSTSPTSSTTTSRRRSRTTSMRSRAASRSASSGCGRSTSAPRDRWACATSSTISARSTRGR